MRVLYCWDAIEHLAARQIDAMLKVDDSLSFVVATKFVPDDSEVQKILALYYRLGIFFLLSYFFWGRTG